MSNKMKPESNDAFMNFSETELTLSLPGKSRVSVSSGNKRVDASAEYGCTSVQNKRHKKDSLPENESCETADSPAPKAQVVGWPPLKSQRKKMMLIKSKYVKVAVDGAPYLRKVDLDVYNSYDELLRALEGLFACFTIVNVVNEKKLMDPANGLEYVPTYEDKDGDWMLVGDVPWGMFAQSCKRLRLMTRSETIGLSRRTPPNCSSSTC